MKSKRVIQFTGEFSLLSAIAVCLFCWFVYLGELPWWSVLIAWLYQMNFLVIDLKKLLKIGGEKPKSEQDASSD